MVTMLSNQQIKTEIAASHQRSKEFGISSEERDANQEKLSPTSLEARRFANRDLIRVVLEYIKEFFDLVSADDFMIAMTDNEGYILTLEASDELKLTCAERNCTPGYRWTERDVGTTAISLCLEKQVPIQLNDDDHYCKRAHGYTSSAAPIFGHGNALQAVLVVSGSSEFVHPHTLIMVTSAARSIEKQLRLLRRNMEMSLYTNFLDQVVESAETGLLTMDRDMRIWKANRKCKQILMQKNLDGKPVSVLTGLTVDLNDIYLNPTAWEGRECHIQHKNKVIHLLYSAQPVVSDENELLGAVIVFQEFGNIRKLAAKISRPKAIFTFDHLIGQSDVFKRTLELARRASQSDSTVLLLGETGTGKELLAQAIHNAGIRKNQEFVPVNCGAIPGELIESELFGYVDGAFTGAIKGGRPGMFELASNGTILLDEIGDMPHNLQVKLLRVLQTGEIQRIGSSKLLKVNTRVIASTHVSLSHAIKENKFRQDLYYRLNILPIKIPPLRERGGEDIKALAKHFVNKINPNCELSPEALDVLIAYDWPGNARELENMIQRAMHICDGKWILVEHLGPLEKAGLSVPPQFGSLREMEQQMIITALEETGSNMVATAKKLGISRATLYRKVKTYHL